jgi:predicted anti-sigma-YlaC factor YlaD
MTGRPFDEITCQRLVEIVTDYLEDAMPSAQRLRFEEHLAFCSACGAYLEQMRQTIELMGALREDDLEPAVRDDMLRVFGEFRHD